MPAKFIPLEKLRSSSGNWLSNFYFEQKNNWALLNKNIVDLNSLKEKLVKIENNYFTISFNSNRTASTLANVDEKSVGLRKCFLCEENLYPEQQGIIVGEYIILCNPFPVSEMHFTISHKEHIPQKFRAKEFISLIDIFPAEQVIFYNGPKCGASAPDHLHYQSIPKSKLHLIEFAETIMNNSGETTFVNNSFPNFVVIQSNSVEVAENSLTKIIQTTGKYFRSESEPMINVLGWKSSKKYKLILILRKKHRPDIFFAEKNGIKISPAAADLGGLFVTISSNDFDKMNEEITKQIIDEVTITRKEFLEIENLYNSAG